MQRKIMSSDQILEMASAYQKSRLILTAFELDIFTIIGSGNLRSTEIATSICAPHNSTERLLNALCAIGLLNKEKGLFSNTQASARFLAKDSGEYLSRIGHMINLYRSWATLTDAVRAGRSVTAREYDETSLARFIEAMHQRAGKSAMELISHIDLTGVSRVLDVGGGSGVYSMAFARTKPGLLSVVFDLPQVIKLSEKYIGGSGLSDKVKTMKGDYNADDFGAGYDLVFMSAIIHINSREENQSLINRAYASLNPGGRIVIQDHIMDEDKTTPVRGALFSLNMLVNTESGDSYTEQEMRTWLAKAGFLDIQRIRTGMDNDLMSGKRRT
jgi:2-polyprenyl-3-methyl-5-hydroxy-6-metoxy-1,4-benzoquinol methylase